MQKTVRVYANPYLCLDEEGSPCCAVAFADSPGRHIAAQRVVRSAGEPFKNHDNLTADKTGFDFSADAVEIKVDIIGGGLRYYRNAIAEGALVCADRESAAVLGVPFEDPQKKLAETKARAASEFQSMFGKAPEWAPKKADKASQGG